MTAWFLILGALFLGFLVGLLLGLTSDLGKH